MLKFVDHYMTVLEPHQSWVYRTPLPSQDKRTGRDLPANTITRQRKSARIGTLIGYTMSIDILDWKQLRSTTQDGVLNFRDTQADLSRDLCKSVSARRTTNAVDSTKYRNAQIRRQDTLGWFKPTHHLSCPASLPTAPNSRDNYLVSAASSINLCRTNHLPAISANYS